MTFAASPPRTFEASGRPSGWKARLAIDLDDVDGRTRVARVEHFGPLRIQRPFYPEDDGTSHLYLLHPPGGIVGGDELDLAVRADFGSKSLFTTPAATKLYRSSGATSVVRQELRVHDGATLEWLPQETIAFSGARADVRTVVQLEESAQFFGWDVLCLGRPAAGERFVNGQLSQRFELWRNDVPLFLDRLSVSGGGGTMEAAWGLGGAPVTGTLLVAGNRGLLPLVRGCLPPTAGPRLGATELEGAVVVRYVGSSVVECWTAFSLVWNAVRPVLKGTPAHAPRIWSC